jgi:hypothetical protein
MLGRSAQPLSTQAGQAARAGGEKSGQVAIWGIQAARVFYLIEIKQ